ncbi:arylsulfotransferase ASST [Tamaricihabitans halophyticus]|uniref:Arylsulfotransferase ASST n=1 Tax=Tamaricihabitans halophyticus TaxID=1262583 RepID=A0A4R2QWW6_9PSEU|nr:arylsulfotransferase family protein [Tamaricihabitans halophyticus]TCP53639.1 arylsulfotransferase ASST [Tamaricihabitans halophyticus]
MRGTRGDELPHRQRGLLWLPLGTALLLALVWAVASAPAAANPSTAVPHDFVTRPDLTPPVINVHTAEEGTAPGHIFLSPRGTDAQTGPLIVDDSGQPVWSKRVGDGEQTRAMDFKAQRYQGEPVLTWWQTDPEGGQGQYVIMNQRYEQIATVEAGNGLNADQHEMIITSRDTALLVIYHGQQENDRPVIEGVVQEVDPETGDVLFEWHSLDDVPVSESVEPPPEDPGAAHDYFHINSVYEDAEGNLLISARHTSTIYQIDRETRKVSWRLGGKNSDFAVAEDAEFGWQHDARWLPDGRLSLLDNVSKKPGPPSRALVLDVDTEKRTADVARSFPHPDGTTSVSQSNNQVLPNGHSFVGWGSQPSYTEFDANGEVLLHADFGAEMQSYRAFRLPWQGFPQQPPDVVGKRATDGTIQVYTSWNGSTETRSWRILAGATPDDLQPVAETDRDGFETMAPIDGEYSYVATEALDGNGQTLGTAKPVRVIAANSQ